MTWLQYSANGNLDQLQVNAFIWTIHRETISMLQHLYNP